MSNRQMNSMPTWRRVSCKRLIVLEYSMLPSKLQRPTNTKRLSSVLSEKWPKYIPLIKKKPKARRKVQMKKKPSRNWTNLEMT